MLLIFIVYNRHMSDKFYTTVLTTLYGESNAPAVEARLHSLIEQFRSQITRPADDKISERDAMLITYGDQVTSPAERPLQTLAGFCCKYLKETISSVHLLPFYPSSSDDGFAVKDFLAVDPSLGTWDDIETFGSDFRLMFDAVINHISSQSSWAEAFNKDKAPFKDFFITADNDEDLSQVFRPRTSPLLHEFRTTSGPRRVWTTFSQDQMDLNYHNPDVLLSIIEILLTYIKHGAFYLRLDAIAFLWKEIGTRCLHQPQTHAIIQLLRAVLEDIAPHVRLITETNVPHQENMSYFGNGSNEAHLVYNFALPPLVLHTFLTQDASKITEWAKNVQPPSRYNYLFNFLASHDGIGLNPVRDILSQQEIDALVETTQQHGGLVSYSSSPDGSQRPYELNINFFDALSNPGSKETLDLQVKRFLSAQAIILSLRGLPGIYFHSLFGSRNWRAGVIASGINRRINRQKLTLKALETDLSDPNSLRAKVFQGYKKLLSARASSSAFHPAAAQNILSFGKGIFALERVSLDGLEHMLCLHNITTIRQQAGNLLLKPYETRWIKNPERKTT